MVSSGLTPRAAVSRFEPYVPGRSLEEVKREHGLTRLAKLASNENPLGPSPRAIQALRRCAPYMFLYPDSFSQDLRVALAKHLHVQTGQVVVGAGSDELIELLAKAYLNPGDEIVVSEHAFVRYRMAGELMGAPVVSVPMKNHTHDLEAMARAVTPRTKFVFVANPNNPTGTYNTKTEVEEFLITLPAKVVPVFDEAYFEYAQPTPDYADALNFFRAGRNLIVLRTFSKIHALAGLRVGYGVAAEDVVATLDRVRPPFNVSRAAQAAAQAALGDKGQIRRSLALVKKEKRALERVLRKYNVATVPSVANFLLVSTAPRGGREVFQALLKEGVVVRAMDEYDYPQHIRVTVGLPEENKRFVMAFKNIIRHGDRP